MRVRQSEGQSTLFVFAPRTDVLDMPPCRHALRARVLHGFVRLVHTLVALVVLSTLDSVAAMAAPSVSLTRYPYLTDSIQTSITVNWATTTAGGTAGSLKWGPAGSCTANTTP